MNNDNQNPNHDLSLKKDPEEEFSTWGSFQLGTKGAIIKTLFLIIVIIILLIGKK